MQDSAPNTYLVTKKPDISYVIKKYETTDNNNLKQFKKYIPYCGPSCQDLPCQITINIKKFS